MTREERDGEVNKTVTHLNGLNQEDTAIFRVPLGCALPLSSLNDWEEACKKRDKERQELRYKLRQLASQPVDD